MNKLSYLSQVCLFEALPVADLMEIDRMAPMNRIRKNTLLQTPETFQEGLYIIKEGKLRLYKINQDGKQFTVGIIGKGNVFGEMDSFSLGTRDLFIETLEETLLCSLSKGEFERFLIQRPDLMLKVLRVLSNQLQDRDQLLEKLALGGVRERLLHLLLKYSDQFGIQEGDYYRIDLPLTHQELANMIGVTRESVTVVLQELAKLQVVRTGRKSIYVQKEKARGQMEG